jgi:hypothetical protein
VRSKEKYVFWLHRLDDSLHVVVVTLVGRIDVVPDWRLHVISFGELALLVHVCSTDELDTEVEAKGLRCLYFTRNHVGHALHVALVTVHDDGLVAAVVPVGHLLAERLDSGLDESLLSIHVEGTVALISIVSQSINPTNKFVEIVKIFLSQTANFNRDLFLERSHRRINREKVAMSVSGEGLHVAVDAHGSIELVEVFSRVVSDAVALKVGDELLSGEDAFVGCSIRDLKNVSGESFLSKAELLHELSRDKGGQLEREVTLLLVLGQHAD